MIRIRDNEKWNSQRLKKAIDDKKTDRKLEDEKEWNMADNTNAMSSAEAIIRGFIDSMGKDWMEM